MIVYVMMLQDLVGSYKDGDIGLDFGREAAIVGCLVFDFFDFGE